MVRALRNDPAILRSGRRPHDAPIDRKKVEEVREAIKQKRYEDQRRDAVVDRLLDEIFKP